MINGIVAALDVGERRIGVAVASLFARLPAAYTTIDRQKTPDAVQEVCDIVAKENITELVVGLPRDMRGVETEQTKKVLDFAKELKGRLSIPVIMQDEAVTSVEAEDRLKSTKRPYTKADIDAEAAAIILRDYLAGREASVS